MKHHATRRTALTAFFMALAALILLSSATFAWFTFRPYTNVTPMMGIVDSKEGNLLISTQRDGAYDVECELVPEVQDPELRPVTTADLETFFQVRSQDPTGVALTYAEAEERANDNTIHGKVYLKAEGRDFDVYLWRDEMDCSADDQALAALRLGLKITTDHGTEIHIFKLDDLGNTGGAEAQVTIPTAGQVVSSISGDGTASYTEDPSIDLSECFAGGTVEEPTPGAKKLCTLNKDEIAEVEYRLYLEGCDDNCINSVQQLDTQLQLSFLGIELEEQ